MQDASQGRPSVGGSYRQPVLKAIPNVDCWDFWQLRDLDNVTANVIIVQIEGYLVTPFCVRNMEAFMSKIGGRKDAKLLPVECGNARQTANGGSQ